MYDVKHAQLKEIKIILYIRNNNKLNNITMNARKTEIKCKYKYIFYAFTKF